MDILEHVFHKFQRKLLNELNKREKAAFLVSFNKIKINVTYIKKLPINFFFCPFLNHPTTHVYTNKFRQYLSSNSQEFFSTLKVYP